MKLSEVKQHLQNMEAVHFKLPNGGMVPINFHITEVGQITKHFIDCGGTIRNESLVSFQLWDTTDYDHRLQPSKLLNIIQLSEEKLGLKDGEVEVEYQGETIGKFGLHYDGRQFQLTNKSTACLASDQCGIPTQKAKVKLSDLTPVAEMCTPGSGCC